MTEVATECDECFEPIGYNVTCYAVPNGFDLDESTPIVKIVCESCYVARLKK